MADFDELTADSKKHVRNTPARAKSTKTRHDRNVSEQSTSRTSHSKTRSATISTAISNAFSPSFPTSAKSDHLRVEPAAQLDQPIGAGSLVITLDRNARILSASGNALSFVSDDIDELVGNNFFSRFFSVKQAHHLREMYDRFIAQRSDEFSYFESPLTNHRGDELLFVWHALLMDDKERCLCIGIDITQYRNHMIDQRERDAMLTAIKNSELSLRQTQQLLLGSEKLSHIGSWEWYINSAEVHWSPELFRIFGKDASKQGLLDFESALASTHPDDKERVDQHLKHVIETCSSQPISFRIIRPDGSIRHLHVDCELDTDENNNVTRMFGYAQDITDRLKTEMELRERNEKYTALFNQSIFGVAQVDSSSGHFLEVNQRWCNLLGYSAEELKSSSFLDIIHPEDIRRDQEFLDKLHQDSLFVPQWETRFIRKDGSIMWSNLSIILFTEQERNWHLSIIDDISNRKQVEKTLHRQRKEQKQILDSISDAILLLDNELNIVSYNSSSGDMFGYSSDTLTNKSLQSLIPASSSNNIRFYNEFLERTINPENSEDTIEVTGVHANGSRFPLRVSVSDLAANDDNTTRLVVTCHDLRREKQQEEQLRRTQKMDALGKLTGGIAHDYNNMLGVIVGYTKLLHDALEHNPKLSSYLSEIQNATERGSRLSRKLLVFSKNIPLDTEIIDINESLIAEREMLEKTLTPRITLKYELSEQLWPVNMNPGDLLDAILNICINAMQSIEFTGYITISTKNLSIKHNDLPELSLQDGDYVAINISDTGVGIAANNLPKIFDPFFTTKGQHGVGLGLSMVYGFVKRSQGDIKVRSMPGKGSVFSLFFPRFIDPAPQRKLRKPSRDSNERYSAGEKVLVVDDEPAMLTLCTEILSAKGYQCSSASSAEQALESVDFHDIDILISDVIMPGMDGYQFVETVKNLNPGLKVLLISGFTDNRQNRHSSHASIPLLHKPFSADELLNQVGEILHNASGMGPPQTPRILVMDDDDNLLSLYQINLQRLGYEVETAYDGEQAIRLFAQSFHKHTPFDVAILDLAIPGGMGGSEAAQAILEIDPNACLIVSSGDSYGDIMTNYKEYGFKAVLEKNFDRNTIKRVIEQLLAEKYQTSPHPQPA